LWKCEPCWQSKLLDQRAERKAKRKCLLHLVCFQFPIYEKTILFSIAEALYKILKQGKNLGKKGTKVEL